MIILTAEQAQQIEEALEDIVRVFKFETGTPVEALAVIRAARAQEQAEQEPVAWMRENEDCTDCFVWERDEGHTIPLYTAPPSVEAAIEATKEKAAKVCFSHGVKHESGTAFGLAAAIRGLK